MLKNFIMALGGSFLAAALYSWVQAEHRLGAWHEVTGIVVSGATGGKNVEKAVIAFAAASGHVVEKELSGSYKAGEAMALLVNPENAHDAVVKSQNTPWNLLRLGVVFGTLAIVTGFMIGHIGNVQQKKRERLRTCYRYLEATVLKIEKNDPEMSDEDADYRLVAYWKHPVTGQAHGFIVEPVIHEQIVAIRGKRVRVRVDRDDLNNYEVELG